MQLTSIVVESSTKKGSAARLLDYSIAHVLKEFDDCLLLRYKIVIIHCCNRVRIII